MNRHIDVFSENNKEFNSFLQKFGFKTEQDMLLNIEEKNLDTSQLKEIIDYAFHNFDYEEDELIKIIYAMFRRIWD